MNIAKRVGVSALITFLTALFPAAASAAGSNVGVFGDYDGIYCESESDYTAYSKECVRLIESYLGNEYSEGNVTTARSSEIYAALGSGTLDYALMASASTAKSVAVDYVSSPVCTAHVSLYVLPETDCWFEDFTHMNGMRVGVSTDGSGASRSMVEQYTAEHGIGVSITEYGTNAALCAALDKGEIDAMAIEHVSRVESRYRIIGKCGITQLYCVVQKGNTAELDKLNRAMTKMLIDTPFYTSRIYAQYFGRPVEYLNGMTREEHEAVQEHSVVKLAAPSENYPLDYFDKDGNFCGVYKNVLDWIAQETGLEFQVSAVKSEDELYEKTQSGAIDGVVETYGSDNGGLTLTNAYITTDYNAVIKSGATLSKDGELKASVNSHAYSAIKYLEETFPNWELVECDDADSAIKAVESGSANCALVSASVMQTRVTLASHDGLEISTDLSISVPVSMGLNASLLPENIISLINKRISVMPDSVADNAVELATVTNTYVPGITDLIRRYGAILFITILAILAVAFVYFLRRSRKYQEMTIRDPLTGLYNRIGFEAACDRKLEHSESKHYYMAVIDMDNFRAINETLGRENGDKLLKTIADRLKIEFPDALCARDRGDTFMLMTDKTPEMLEKLHELPAMNFYSEDSVTVQTSLRVGICPTDMLTDKTQLASKIIHRANLTRQTVKDLRYNHVGVYSVDMEKDMNNRRFVEKEMERALEEGQFYVYYQPKYDTAHEQIIGAEALVRWKHPERGIIGPNLFIPVFEKNGFITKLDFYVYEETIKFIKDRLDNGLKIVPISVNISRYHLHDATFVDDLDSLVLKYDIPKDMLELEITESTFGDNDMIATNFMRQLKARGFTISMDDFGSGYSSLNLLRELPIDVLKIDKEFLPSTLENERGMVIISNVLHMAFDMHIQTICEGVETVEQFNFLKDAGCDMVQGYLFARPMPKEDFEQLLAG